MSVLPGCPYQSGSSEPTRIMRRAARTRYSSSGSNSCGRPYLTITSRSTRANPRSSHNATGTARRPPTRRAVTEPTSERLGLLRASVRSPIGRPRTAIGRAGRSHLWPQIVPVARGHSDGASVLAASSPDLTRPIHPPDRGPIACAFARVPRRRRWPPSTVFCPARGGRLAGRPRRGRLGRPGRWGDAREPGRSWSREGRRRIGPQPRLRRPARERGPPGGRAHGRPLRPRATPSGHDPVPAHLVRGPPRRPQLAIPAPQSRLDAPPHRGHVGDRRGALPRPRPRPRPVVARGQPSRGPAVRLLLERPQHRTPCPGPRLPRECGAGPRLARGWAATPRVDAGRPGLLREPRQPRAQPGHRPVGGRLLSRPRRLEAARPEAHRRPPRAERRPPGGRERAGDRLRSSTTTSATRSRARSLRACGLPAPAGFELVRRVPRFLGHATQPDGRYPLIGDTLDVAATVIPGTIAAFAATPGRAWAEAGDRHQGVRCRVHLRADRLG